jgi:hypothetical protein
VQSPRPSDWVYVNNFADADRPVAIELPAGRARKFQDVMRKLIDDLKSALPAVFQSEDYQTRRGAIDEAFQKKQGEAFSALRERAAEKNVIMLRIPLGIALAVARNGKVVPPDEFGSWPEAKQREVQAVIEALEKDLEHIIHQIPQWEKQRRDEVRKLNGDTAKYAVDATATTIATAAGEELVVIAAYESTSNEPVSLRTRRRCFAHNQAYR